MVEFGLMGLSGNKSTRFLLVHEKSGLNNKVLSLRSSCSKWGGGGGRLMGLPYYKTVFVIGITDQVLYSGCACEHLYHLSEYYM